ncbi:hypothetical protein [Acidianus manzaensis]|uniref:Uncharacterized protein n=1 Tax=Acidianus manzaensis TaxID=282676 RepID=A0A1W6K2G5_9CREN|nr:hypothetical protein [Acidianus manzaensis]ARM76634.1 hypothetical protein B6F84_11820 [Acidianus manzaensis]
MVKLINWKKASKEEKNNAKSLLKDNYDVIIILKPNSFIEYIKSHDLDTNDQIIIRREKKTSLYKEINRLASEKFTIKVVVLDDYAKALLRIS